MKAVASEGHSKSNAKSKGKAPLHSSHDETVRCPECSEFLAYSYMHCKKCGVELTDEHRALMTAEDQPGRVNSLNAGLFVFLALIVLFMLGVYLLF